MSTELTTINKVETYIEGQKTTKVDVKIIKSQENSIVTDIAISIMAGVIFRS